MLKTWISALILSTALAGSPVLAADAPPPATAEQVAAMYQKIFDLISQSAPGVFVAKPEGDKTRLTIDMSKLFAPLEKAGVVFKIPSVTYLQTTLPDGLLHSTYIEPKDFSYELQIPAPNEQLSRYKIEGLSSDLTIDPKFFIIRDFNGRANHVSGDISQASSGATVRVDGGEIVARLAGTPADGGMVDFKLIETIGTLSEHIHFDPAKADKPTPGPVIDADIKIGPTEGMATFTGVRSTALRDLLVFISSAASPADLQARQTELKPYLHQFAPVFKGVDILWTIGEFTVTTGYGNGGAKIGKFALAADTASPSSSASIGYTFDGIHADSVFIPDWSKPLIPTGIDLQFGGRDFDVTSGLNKVIDLVDFTKPKPIADADGPAIAAAFLPTGGGHFDLKPSSITAPTYNVNWQGTVDARAGHAKAHIDVTARGLDAVIKSLSTVKEAGVPQVIIGLYGAKALAKPGPDGTSVWAIELDDSGAVLVNGAAVGGKRK